MKRGIFILISGFLLLASPFSPAIVDKDNSGVSDVTELQYNNGQPLAPNADPDGDGWTNSAEFAASTNPFDANAPNGYVRPSVTDAITTSSGPDGNGGTVISTLHTIQVAWPTKPGVKYTLLYSTDLTPESWQPVPLAGSTIGTGTVIEFNFPLTNPTKTFWRVKMDEVDTDSDGVTDSEEHALGLDTNEAETVPGFADLWIAQNFLAELMNGGSGAFDPNGDADGDGASNADEATAGTDPKSDDPAASRQWVRVKGDGPMGVAVTKTGTLTIPAGQSGILLIAIASEEFPEFTSTTSPYDDILTWNVQPSTGTQIQGAVHVNDRHQAWILDKEKGTSLPGFPKPVHLEEIRVLTAPADADLTLQVGVTATNVSDALLPSHIGVGLLQMSVAVDADRNGDITFDGKDQRTNEKPFRFWVNNDQDDVEVDEPFNVNQLDSFDTVIKAKRDLEDFCRLDIKLGISSKLLSQGAYKIGLRFRNKSTPGPSIRIWPNQSIDGDDSYMMKDASAASQVAMQTYGRTDGGTVVIPPNYWGVNDDSTVHLIFEGIGVGTGELAIVLQDKNGWEIAEAPGTWMKLMDVRSMYQRARIIKTPEEIATPWADSNPPTAQDWTWDPWNWSYSEDPEVQPVSVVYVHGWRMPYGECLQWSQTSYKRLWHQGFKGKFYAFRWPTFAPSYFTYNDSEYRAWLCGPALAAFVNQLPDPPKDRSIFAHSMGNIITGSALRSGMHVQNYALCNAAVPAMAYDPAPALKKNHTTGEDLDSIFFGPMPHKTPDTDVDPTIRENFGFQDKLYTPNIPHQPEVMFNFGLPIDWALSNWVLNNCHLKPDAKGHSYYYQHVPQPPNISFKLFQAPPNAAMREVTGHQEAFAYVTKSLTRTVGADLRTEGSITGFQNMNDWPPGANHGGFGDEHSAIWLWNNQSTNEFWKRLMEVFKLK